jgi:hypothetical protein
MSPTQATRRRRYQPTPRHVRAGSPHHTTPHEHTRQTKSLGWTKMLTKLSVMSRGSVMTQYGNVWCTVQAKCPNRMKMMVDKKREFGMHLLRFAASSYFND